MTEAYDIDEIYMKEAIAEAQKAALHGDVPIGCVIVFEGKIIAAARNERELDKNALCHAELTAIEEACRVRGGWRLFGCTLYVTLEPCPMCAGAIINARIDNVYFGAYDSKAGSFGSVTDLSLLPYNHRPEIHGGILKEECGALLSDFFKKLRAENKLRKEKNLNGGKK